MVLHGIHDERPATVWPDAYLSGNGTHGALVFGPAADETVVVTHHSLVLPNGTARMRAPLLADRMEQIRDLILAGRDDAALSAATEGLRAHAVQPFHPAFGLRMVLSPPPDPGPPRDYRRATDFRTGVVSTGWADGDGRWLRQCFVSRADDVVVMRLVPPSGAAGARRDIRLEYDVRLPGAPEGLRVRQVRDGPGVRGEGPAADAGTSGVLVGYPAPGGGAVGYVGVSRTTVEDGSVLVLTRVVRVGADGRTDDSYARCVSALSALSGDYDTLLERHLRLHRTAYQRVELDLGVDLGDGGPPVAELPGAGHGALLERLFHAGRYHLLSAAGSRPPRLVGLWQGDWHAAWSGAFTLDANLGLQLAGVVAGDLPEVADALLRLVEDQLPDWRANAARLFGARGVVAPAHTDGENGAALHASPAWPLHVWTAGAAWLLVTLTDHARARGDRTLLTRRVLPLLEEVGSFYEDFLTRRDPNGHAVFVPSYSPENAPRGRSPLAVNATMDLAAARRVLSDLVDLRESLAARDGTGDGAHAVAAARWRAVRALLPPYRVDPDGALAEWAWPGLASSDEHRHLSHLFPVWPLHDITPDETPELARAAHRALVARGHEDHSAHGYLHQLLAAARLRDAELVDRLLRRLLDGRFCFDSLMTSHYPDREVFNADAACGLPGVLLEALVDSRPGLVVLLPAVPHLMPAGRLRGVRTLAGPTVTHLVWDLAEPRVAATLTCDVRREVVVEHAGVRRAVTVSPGAPVQVAFGSRDLEPLPVPYRAADTGR